jgi:hypothetical protein
MVAAHRNRNVQPPISWRSFDISQIAYGVRESCPTQTQTNGLSLASSEVPSMSCAMAFLAGEFRLGFSSRCSAGLWMAGTCSYPSSLELSSCFRSSAFCADGFGGDSLSGSMRQHQPRAFKTTSHRSRMSHGTCLICRHRNEASNHTTVLNR